MSAQPQQDEFIAALQALGGKAGNGALRDRLGWNEADYRATQTALIQVGAIMAGRGRGGSVILADGTPPTEATPPRRPPAAATPEEAPRTRRSGGAVRKSDLYASLWASCDALRGGMDASQYKDYILVLLFVKYVSDRFAGKPFAAIEVPAGASFADMVALKGTPDIGDQINKRILGPLAQANQLADMPDFNDPAKLGTAKEMVDRLTDLIAIFENPALDFSNNQADGDDLLGDAYEYLMRHFATESGKSKGQFYTPAEVSRVIAQLLGIRRARPSNNTTVYDPTCGSGSLLLKVADEAAQGTNLRVTLYGQEKDSSTANLARMNMILHDYGTAEIMPGNTLAGPRFLDGAGLKTFDYVVANPPFSDKRWSTGLDAEHDTHGRFAAYGVPPARQGDYAYLLHILRSLKPSGQGACILPHGVLFRGNAEGAIRRKLIQRGYLKAIIGLPANLFYGTGIPACILVLDKAGAAARAGIFMIDASRGFRKDGPKNRLREQDIHRIVDVFARQQDTPGYARMVPVSEIAEARNDYNLNLPRYIDTAEPEDIQDIGGHLQGGIPERDVDALARTWAVIPGVRDKLFEPLRPGYLRLRMPVPEIKPAIFGHGEFKAFDTRVTAIFAAWRAATLPTLRGFGKGGRPKALLEGVAESLLEAFRVAPLLDAYDVYQHLMDYAAATLLDDAHRIAAEGWEEAARPWLMTGEAVRKGRRPDLVVGRLKYQAELIPPVLLIGRYFDAEQQAIAALEAECAALAQELEEMEEEQGAEGGLLEAARNDAGKLTRTSATARLEEVAADDEGEEERVALRAYLALVKREAAKAAALKARQEALMVAVLARYGVLTEGEIKLLVVEDKWLAVMEGAVRGEMERVSQALTGRVRESAERYAVALPELDIEQERLAALVAGHLRKLRAA